MHHAYRKRSAGEIALPWGHALSMPEVPDAPQNHALFAKAPWSKLALTQQEGPLNGFAGVTALKKYQRLEAMGLWRPDPGAQRREVVVSFGEATLVFRDPRADTPLSHWSLAAIERLNPGQEPALFAPDTGEEAETVEIKDAEMLEAIGAVRAAIAARRPHPWRLRLGIAGLATLLIAAAVFWGIPRVLFGHTAQALPFAARVELGRAGLRAMEPYTGRACATPEGSAALRRLALRLNAGGAMQLVVLRDGVHQTIRLPGRLILIDRRLIEREVRADVLAGHILHAALRELPDPAEEMLKQAGVMATLRLLTTGEIPDDALSGYARAKLLEPLPEVHEDRLIEVLGQAGVASTPYALSIDPSGRSTRSLIEADPMASATATAPAILTDADWVQLQAICEQ